MIFGDHFEILICSRKALLVVVGVVLVVVGVVLVVVGVVLVSVVAVAVGCVVAVELFLEGDS